MSNEWTPPPGGAASGSVPNYMIPAIISIFCCLPGGIAAVIFASQVNKKVAAGDMAGALDASKKAKMIAFISIGLGIVGNIIGFMMGLAGGIMGNM